ncbi:MAG: site-specific integrase [Deltaproteobacteria bacterium]|nr:site-specific integrase [Deltaproteobacteria bacterium]
MGKPNANGLPEHLRRDAKGLYIDYFVQEGGFRKRKRVRLGQVPVVQAKRILATHMQAILENRFLAPQRPKTTFNEAAQSFLEYSRSRKKSSLRDGQLVAHLSAFFGDRPLESLTLNMVESYVGQRRRQREGIKDATLNREIACLKTIVNRAVLNRQIDRNPIEGVQLFKETPRTRTLSPDEYQRLLDNCSVHLKPMVRLAYVTAMRRGEIVGLRWVQVDLSNRVIHLEATSTKTQEKREVPLDDALVAMLRQVPKTLGSPHVFTYRGKHMRDIKKAFNMACARAGIKDFRFHDLRHCAITNLRKAGVPDNVIMSISGHKTAAMFRRYDSVDRSDRHRALQQLGEYDTDMTRTDLRVDLQKSVV